MNWGILSTLFFFNEKNNFFGPIRL